MCGIIGIIDQKGHPVEPAELDRGLRMLIHRGPDGEGTYFGENFAFGHRRLAIFDLSQRGDQPMEYQGFVIVFNGAIYNFPELKHELQKRGYRFRTETDTELILAAYQEWGENCVERFNGQWAFGIYDPVDQIVFCSRDRFGIKPFYYTCFDNKFHFASEIKAFFTLKGWKKQLNTVRAYEFLAYGLQDHTSHTLYGGVHQLPAGCNLVYNLKDHSWKIRAYYHLQEQLRKITTGFNETKERFLELLRDAVRLRLRADVPIGSALSGGLDSSSLVRVMLEWMGDGSLTTVSACFPAVPEIDETQYIKALHKEQSFRALKVFPEAKQFQHLQEKVAWHQDEPLSSNSQVAQYLVFQKASTEGLKVMLDGQGADEILGGYPKFYATYFKSLARDQPLKLFSAFYNFLHLHRWSYQKIWDKMTNLNAKSKGLLPAWIHPGFLPDPEKLYRPAPVANMQALSIQLITEMGLPALLHYEDRNAMAHGVESRLPFLDHRLVEFCLSLPDDFRIRQARRKFILREAMQPYLPKVIYQRYDKLGFAVPDWSPPESQLVKSIAVLQQAEQPILKTTFDIHRLPGSIKQRIHFFSQFVQN